MVLHEYKPPKCFPNTSLTIRLSRLLIRTDTSLDRDSRWDSTSARPFTTELCPRTKTLVGLHECEIIPPDQNCVHQDSRGTHECERRSTSLVGLHECDQIPSSQHMSKDKPKLCWLDASRETCDTSRCGQQSNRREQCERRGSCAQS